ncbi:unnamed protein product [Protopolystoma xenopodis]|uniref:Uncharacterized protein n=1 Tax=Protopolystoma xenopodis TaxID=117903 RepID=A0A448W9Z5_9PLAT|nr:unnamed protein product [Protopolystoma xenopodis]
MATIEPKQNTKHRYQLDDIKLSEDEDDSICLVNWTVPQLVRLVRRSPDQPLGLKLAGKQVETVARQTFRTLR